MPVKLPPPKKKAQAQHTPETADEYLAAGVEFEEAGEKWRAGDAAKSLRFFQRAIDNYDVALTQFPSSFDLVYNRARVLFQITQYPLLLQNYGADLESALRAALDAHNRAIQLQPDDIDALFNTAQVSSTLADEIQERASTNSPEALNIYQTTLDLFSHCLALQEAQYEQQQISWQNASKEPLDASEQDGGVSLGLDKSPSSTETPSENQWASVQESVTVMSLLDTAAELLDTLSDLCDFIIEGQEVSAQVLGLIQQKASDLIRTKIPAYLSKAGSEEVAQDPCRLASLSCQASIHEATFQVTRDLQAYDAGLKATFPDNYMTTTSDIQVIFVDACIGFAVAISDIPNTASLRWDRLNIALQILGEAAKHPGEEDVAQIHMRRGDIEMYRFGLCASSDLRANLRTDAVRMTTIKNACTYYNGALRNAQRSGPSHGTRSMEEAAVKYAIAQCIAAGGSSQALKDLAQSGLIKDPTVISRRADRMVEDELIDIATRDALIGKP